MKTVLFGTCLAASLLAGGAFALTEPREAIDSEFFPQHRCCFQKGFVGGR
jgi:hypothetical protein